MQIVSFAHQTDVVAPCEVVPDETGVRIVSKTKAAGHIHRLNRFARRLEGNVHPKIANARNTVRRPTARSLTRKTEASVIQKRRGKNMVFMNEVVVRWNRR